eukprot:9012727-Pyramimonas_sp.AAC.1
MIAKLVSTRLGEGARTPPDAMCSPRAVFPCFLPSVLVCFPFHCRPHPSCIMLTPQSLGISRSAGMLGATAPLLRPQVDRALA